MVSIERAGEAALRFAASCLLQPGSILAKDGWSIEVLPDGYNAGPESFADRGTLEFTDLGDVIRVVTFWCRLNFVKLDISYFDESYTCTFTEGNPVIQVVSDDSSDLCSCLLSSCAVLASNMKRVNAPTASMRVSDLLGNTDCRADGK